MPSPSDQKLRVLEGAIAHLTHALQTPSNENPTTRCLKRPRLMALLREALAATKANGIYHRDLATGPKALEALVATGLIHELDLVQAHRTPTHLYVFDARGEQAVRTLSPLEILQATEPKGFACYWSAIEFHSLSTQPCRHQHIGVLRSAPNENAATLDSVPVQKYSLGIHLFDHAQTPYYRNGRDPRLVPDIRKTYANEYSEIRITSLEQTLLDTLHRPHSCGGPEVVFDAWEEARARFDQDLLADLLRKICRPILNRRVGLLLDLTGANVNSTLADTISTAPTFNSVRQEDPQPSLLPGVRFSNWNQKWQLLAP